MFKHGVWVSIKEHLVDSHVKRRNHFLRVCYQLPVQICIELTHMLTVEVEEWLTNDTYLCTHVIIYELHRLTLTKNTYTVSGKKSLQFYLNNFNKLKNILTIFGTHHTNVTFY